MTASLPKPHIHAQALAAMNAGLERGGHVYSAEQMLAYAAEQVAAEREQGSVLTDDMLRYAMAAIGTGSPKEAERLRLFWRFAMEARGSLHNGSQST